MDRVDTTTSQVNLLRVHIVHKVHAVHHFETRGCNARAQGFRARPCLCSAFNLDCRIWVGGWTAGSRLRVEVFDDGFGGLAGGDVH